MKTKFSPLHKSSKLETGSAVMVVLVVLTILVLMMAANTATLNWLRVELNAVEKHQTQRLASSMKNQPQRAQSVTNQPPSK
jgi:nitrate reductase cytochrome c-type subunit